MKLYKIPIEADPQYEEFFRDFEKKYPKFGIVKNFVNKIVVQHLDQMSKQDMQMLYYKNKIFISPLLRNEEFLEEGLVHEIGHILLSRSKINNDEDLKDEFFLKRKCVLQKMLSDDDLDIPPRIMDLLKNVQDFSKELDDFFNKKIGYENLNQYISGYFLDPYGISSFDEYLATGFQLYFSEYRDLLKQTNPLLFKELNELLDKF